MHTRLALLTWLTGSLLGCVASVSRAREDTVLTRDDAPAPAPGAVQDVTPGMTLQIVRNEDAPFEGTQAPLRRCEVERGKVTHCSQRPFTGRTLAQHDGMWRECEVGEGRVIQCDDAYEGTALLPHDGLVRECELLAGQPSSCGADGFTGLVVLPHP